MDLFSSDHTTMHQVPDVHAPRAGANKTFTRPQVSPSHTALTPAYSCSDMRKVWGILRLRRCTKRKVMSTLAFQADLKADVLRQEISRARVSSDERAFSKGDISVLVHYCLCRPQ